MSLRMAVMCPSTGGHEAAVESWYASSRHQVPVVVDEAVEGEQAGYLAKVQKFYAERSDIDLIAYLHSDLLVHETDWHKRVVREFMDERVGVVGFVGATRLGSADLYRTPYDFRQLARADVWSNLSDWSSHGQHELGSRPVAVVDSCAVVVRRVLLARAGGWPVDTYPNNSHCSDLWICCVARRLGFDTRMVGIAATHAGGGKGEAGARWLAGQDTAHHRAAHKLIYDDFPDVIPLVIR